MGRRAFVTKDEKNEESALARGPRGRRIKLTQTEREEFRERQLAERAASMFLDLENNRKWPEIAQELGITIDQLKNLTRGEVFSEVYDAMFSDLGHDPRYKAFAAGMADLLPVALRQLDGLIRTGPPQVRMQAIKFLVETAGVKIKPPDESDERQKLAEFLAGSGITQNVIQVNLGSEFEADIKKYLSQEAPLEGEFVEAPDGDQTSKSGG